MGEKREKTIYLHPENLQKEKVQTDTDNSHTERFSSPELLTIRSGKAKKRKREKSEESRLQTAGHQCMSKLEKKRKIRHENTAHVEDTQSSEEPDKLEDVGHELVEQASKGPRRKKKRHEGAYVEDIHGVEEQQKQDEVEDLLGEKVLPHKQRKKKKRDGQRETGDNLSYKVSVGDTSGTNAEEINVTMDLENKAKGKKKNKHVKEKTAEATCSDCRGESTSKTEGTQTLPNVTVHKSEETPEGYEMANPVIEIGMGFLSKRLRRGVAVEIDVQLLEELRQFVPNVDTRAHDEIVKMIHYDLPRFKEFKKSGIHVNDGKFTAKDNERLRKNVEDFMALTGVDSATKLFFTDRFKEERTHIKKLKSVHSFLVRIAEGIREVAYMFIPVGEECLMVAVIRERKANFMFTKGEIHKLLKLQTLYGNNWKKISDLTGRSAFSLQKRYAQMNLKEGVWSKKEYQRLLRAVRDHIVKKNLSGASQSEAARVSKEALYKKLPWTKISEKVKTRSWTKCREKWMSKLTRKMSVETVCTNKKMTENKIKLIKAMYEMQLEDVALVNWETLSALIGDVPPAYVQRRWHALKVCYVPQWQTKCFADIIDFLYENILPRFEKDASSRRDDDDGTQKQRESFLLSDIFYDIDEEYNIDEDSDDFKRTGSGEEESRD